MTLPRLAALALFLLAGTAQAACSGSGPTRTAASCSRADVNDCITAASAGDTINVPAGPTNPRWRPAWNEWLGWKYADALR